MKNLFISIIILYICCSAGICSEKIPAGIDYFHLEYIKPARSVVPIYHTTIEYKDSIMYITDYISKYTTRYRYVRSVKYEKQQARSMLNGFINVMNYLKFTQIPLELDCYSLPSKYLLKYRKADKTYKQAINFGLLKGDDLTTPGYRLALFTAFFNNMTTYRYNGTIRYWR